MPQAVVSSKVPAELEAALRSLAEERGVTMSALAREALEAVADGRVRFLTREEKRERLEKEAIARITEEAIPPEACIGSPLPSVRELRQRRDAESARARQALRWQGYLDALAARGERRATADGGR
ncbi:MAG: hypothetical protein M3N16_00435 [Actinomycetota bacterium]|nr:hypothetical protein [Actinomycetota bacterium]